jgi:hypothetical protein
MLATVRPEGAARAAADLEGAFTATMLDFWGSARWHGDWDILSSTMLAVPRMYLNLL